MKCLNHLALVTIALLTPSAIAGAAPHRMPADYGQSRPVYELKINQSPVAGQPIVVTLVDHATGQTVRGGEVLVMRPVYLGPKAAPMIQWVPEVLPRGANGTFVCAGEHHVGGERLTLLGEGPGGASPVWLTLNVKA